MNNNHLYSTLKTCLITAIISSVISFFGFSIKGVGIFLGGIPLLVALFYWLCVFIEIGNIKTYMNENNNFDIKQKYANERNDNFNSTTISYSKKNNGESNNSSNNKTNEDGNFVVL